MRWGRLLVGMLIGNAVGVLLFSLVGYLGSSTEGSGPLIYPSLLLIPFSIGLVAAFVWRSLDLSVGMTVAQAFYCTVLGYLGATIFLGEGIICLIIISPVLYVGVLAGALVGRIWFRAKNQKLNLCLGPLVLLSVIAEPSLRGPHTGVVIDEIRIAAPPSKVWPHILAFAEIPDSPDYWLFRLGLPYPTKTTNGGSFIGANRACHFSGDAVFEEKIAEFIPHARLTFDIIKSPPDPELLGHLDAHRGQFELRDNGDGSTTLVGRTWYSLHVRPAWYFDWWTHEVFRAVHLRVMNNVKRLAESAH